MNTRCALVRSTIVLCVIVLNSACTYQTGVEQEYTRSFPVSARADVRIYVANAQVHVTTTQDPNVDFHVRFASDSSDESVPFSARQDGSVVELKQIEGGHEWWGWHVAGVERALVEVRMPRNADLQLQTSNGAIEVTDLNGSIDLHSSNGAIFAGSLKGKLKAGTSNGSIRVENLDGDCEVASSNGRIQVSGRFDSLDIHSSNGGVVARAQSGSTVASRWSIGTSNAGVDLALPPDLKADLDVVTSNGGVQLQLPVTVQGYQDQSHLHGTLNGGGPEVSVHTSNGPIRVTGV